MGKGGRHSSDSSLALAKEKALLDSDSISRLPDDILVDIVSRLDLREAARTSLLSSRWKYFWTFTTTLDFDTSQKLRWLPKGQDEQRSKYISWVNRVLELHRGSRLNYFNITCDLDDSHETIITDWIYQAIAKKVQKLALDLSGCWLRPRTLYTFPQGWYDIIKTPPYLSGLRCLTSLSLARVNITMETLEFFIYNCPLLERLRVEYCSPLLSGALRLVGSSIQLKYLEIHSCSQITEIEIFAVPNLLSFKFVSGQRTKLNIENVPLLVDVSITDYFARLENHIYPIRSYLTQLETLALHLDLNVENIPSLCELPKLKHLTFGVCGGYDSQCLIQLTDIIKACPFLCKFTLEFLHIGERQRRKLHEFPGCSHQHLKVLELIGFSGSIIELEFVFYILKNAINLEKIIVNPANLFELEFEETKAKQVRREKAKQLKERVPQGVDFILL